MFRSATFQLTMWYMVIVMAISIIFSGVLYREAVAVLEWGLHTETKRIYNEFPIFNSPNFISPQQELEAGRHRILIKLLIFNGVVLVSAGVASYWLARRTLEPIEAAHEQQKRFTADVSHELRTPLTALRMESEVVLMNDKSSKVELRETLTSNLEEVSKLEALINNLLRLSQLEADELQQNFVPVSVSSILEQAQTNAAQSAADKKITLTSKSIDATVLGDEKSLVQLVMILLDNAIKYSPDKSEIELQARKQQKDIIISIKDQGVGIPPKELDHVFDRFYRADSSRTKTSAGGYGLGLSIAKMIADVHKAEVTLQSKVGKGTTASIRIAVAPEAQPIDKTA